MMGGWNAILYYKVSARSLYYTRKSVSFKKNHPATKAHLSKVIQVFHGIPRLPYESL